MSRRGIVSTWAMTATLAALGGITAVYLSNTLFGPVVPTFDVRPWLLGAGLVGLNTLSYLVWRSRWNVIAHTQLVFAVIAYVIPIFFLDVLQSHSGNALNTYYQVVLVGVVIAAAGTFLGAMLASPARATRLREKWRFTAAVGQRVGRRASAILTVSVLGILLSFAIMGFAPALAADPLVAKFFRGAYASPYQPVAPLYRFSTSMIALLLPIGVMLLWRRRTVGSLLLVTGAIGVMMLGLLREMAVSGLMLFIGVLLASKRRGLGLYFLLLFGAYFAGSALYSLLGLVGVDAFTTSPHLARPSLLQQVAAGAPDVREQLSFLTHWLASPEYTYGKTFLGGLVPRNFEWNPAVWSLKVVSPPGMDITQISSGGLRLPAPIWGLAAFGWPGVIGVSFLHGIFVGYLARLFSVVIPSTSVFEATCWLVVYAALLDVAPVFFRLSYLSVMQLAVVVWLLFYRTHDHRDPTESRRARLPRELVPEGLSVGASGGRQWAVDTDHQPEVG